MWGIFLSVLKYKKYPEAATCKSDITRLLRLGLTGDFLAKTLQSAAKLIYFCL